MILDFIMKLHTELETRPIAPFEQGSFIFTIMTYFSIHIRFPYHKISIEGVGKFEF